MEKEQRVFAYVMKMLRRHIREINYTSEKNRGCGKTKYWPLKTIARRKVGKKREANEDMDQN